MSLLNRLKLKKSIEEIERKRGEAITEMVYHKRGRSKNLLYRYVRILGRGTFGVVVLVKTMDGAEMALKRTFQDARFRNRELDVMLELDHPNLVSLYYYGEVESTREGRTIDLFMEVCDASLDDIIKGGVAIDEALFESLLRQALSGLKYLEEKSIMHRDIKPANILIVGGQTLKFCDFGNAKKCRAGESNTSYICSRYYRAPECIIGLRDYDMKIDVWSLAVSMLEAVTFSPIFPGDSNSDQLEKMSEIVSPVDGDSEGGGAGRRQEICAGSASFISKYFTRGAIVSTLENMLVFDRRHRKYASELVRIFDNAKNEPA